MSKWSKKTFIDHLNQSCESDVAMHCIELVDFSEKISDFVASFNIFSPLRDVNSPMTCL